MKEYAESRTPQMIQEDATVESAVLPTHARYLGVSVRPDGFGFVVIEDTIALDCGVRVCERTQSDDCLSQQFQRILQMYSPSTVIILATGSSFATVRRNAIVSAIRRKTKRDHFATVRLSAVALRRYFGQFNASTKYEIAQAVVRILPELGWRLPPKRKPWQSEQRRISIFDAAAAVIAYAKL